MKIFVRVKPRARQKKIEKVGKNQYVVSVKEPPQEGKANYALIKALSEYFGVSQTQIKILRGLTSRQKCVEIL